MCHIIKQQSCWCQWVRWYHVSVYHDHDQVSDNRNIDKLGQYSDWCDHTESRTVQCWACAGSINEVIMWMRATTEHWSWSTHVGGDSRQMLPLSDSVWSKLLNSRFLSVTPVLRISLAFISPVAAPLAQLCPVSLIIILSSLRWPRTQPWAGHDTGATTDHTLTLVSGQHQHCHNTPVSHTHPRYRIQWSHGNDQYLLDNNAIMHMVWDDETAVVPVVGASHSLWISELLIEDHLWIWLAWVV